VPEGPEVATVTDHDVLGAPIGELAAGTQIGRYVIVRWLGRGGMGVVYAARDSELGRTVALKLVRPRVDIEAMHARLHREARAMARLSHRNVVPVFDIGTHDGQLFVAMELVAGETLRAWIAQPRPWRDVVHVFARAGRGLAAAHEAGLVHRDFKPDNVMIDAAGEPRITDFGLARELWASDAPGATTAGQRELSPAATTAGIWGTPRYMAPEQLRGTASALSDQFSYCASLFEVLHGVCPFQPSAQTRDAWIAEISADRIATPAHRRRTPRWLHEAVIRGLAFDPERRWPSLLALVDALERGSRRRNRIRAASAGIAIALTAAVVSVAVTRCLRLEPAASPGCLETAQRGNDATTILVCKEEYARANDPRAGAQLADALRRTRKLAEAGTLADELVATPARADALYTLGKIAASEHRPEEAARSLRLASELHRQQQRWDDAARDLLAATEGSRDFADQLVDLAQAASDARRGAAPVREAFSRLAAAVVLSQIGARGAALAELARAEPLVTTPLDRIGLELERGNVHQNLDEHVAAIEAFARALALAEAVPAARRALSARLNLAYSLAEAGRLADAAAQLDAARALDPGDRLLPERLSLEARLAAHRGDGASAADLVERALSATDAGASDDRLELEIQRAEIALQHGDLGIAESWARRAIATIEALRSIQPPVELRSWMITDRRAPYEVLFASLAGRGDAAVALIAFDRMRGLGVLAALARAGSGAPAPDEAFPSAELARLLSGLAASALASPAPDQALRDVVRTGSLLVLVVARGELWRITADAGRLELAHIGPLAALRAPLERLGAAPGDRQAASALGTALVPAALARPSDRALYIVLDEPLAALPIAALVVGDRPLIAARTVVQVARPSAATCARLPGGPRRVIELDARAGRAALFGAAPGDTLRVSAPIARDVLGEALVLRDGRVRTLEIAGRANTAAQIILAPSDGAAAWSLAMAFVAAGARQVVASVRPVSSAVLARVTQQLDRAGGDLARALARMQLARNGDDDLLGFVAYGHSICDIPP
jgi:tetratricopeptide (TPR) repeat protein